MGGADLDDDEGDEEDENQNLQRQHAKAHSHRWGQSILTALHTGLPIATVFMSLSLVPHHNVHDPSFLSPTFCGYNFRTVHNTTMPFDSFSLVPEYRTRGWEF